MADIALQSACAPNIAVAGERRRRRHGSLWAAIAAVWFAVGLLRPAAWWAVVLVFLSAVMSALGFVQAARHTCVLRAKEGTLEHDDLSTTPAEPAAVAASRRVSRGIWRDALAIGAGAAALALIVRSLIR